MVTLNKQTNKIKYLSYKASRFRQMKNASFHLYLYIGTLNH